MVVPAFGGPSAISVAKKALKVANKSNTALLRATKGPADESITSAKIANLTIKNEDIANGAIGTGKIANGALRTEDIGDGQITNAQIADGAVGTGKIANESVRTSDIAGADITGSISLIAGAVPAHSCLTELVDLGGAQVGDVAFMSFVGGTAAPSGLTFQIVKVTAPDLGTLRFCNPTDSASPAFSDVGVRVLTFR